MNKILVLALMSVSAFAQTVAPTPTVQELQHQFEDAYTKQQLSYQKLAGLKDFQDYLNYSQEMTRIQQQAQQIQAASTKPATPPPAPAKK